MLHTHPEEIARDVNAPGDRQQQHSVCSRCDTEPLLRRTVDSRIGIRNIDVNPGNEVPDLESKRSSGVVVVIVVVVSFGIRTTTREIVLLINPLTYKGHQLRRYRGTKQ